MVKCYSSAVERVGGDAGAAGQRAGEGAGDAGQQGGHGGGEEPAAADRRVPRRGLRPRQAAGQHPHTRCSRG